LILRRRFVLSDTLLGRDILSDVLGAHGHGRTQLSKETTAHGLLPSKVAYNEGDAPGGNLKEGRTQMATKKAKKTSKGLKKVKQLK
jgi:hypothetical protein